MHTYDDRMNKVQIKYKSILWRHTVNRDQREIRFCFGFSIAGRCTEQHVLQPTTTVKSIKSNWEIVFHLVAINDLISEIEISESKAGRWIQANSRCRCQLKDSQTHTLSRHWKSRVHWAHRCTATVLRPIPFRDSDDDLIAVARLERQKPLKHS